MSLQRIDKDCKDSSLQGSVKMIKAFVNMNFSLSLHAHKYIVKINFFIFFVHLQKLQI